MQGNFHLIHTLNHWEYLSFQNLYLIFTFDHQEYWLWWNIQKMIHHLYTLDDQKYVSISILKGNFKALTILLIIKSYFLSLMIKSSFTLVKFLHEIKVCKVCLHDKRTELSIFCWRSSRAILPHTLIWSQKTIFLSHFFKIVWPNLSSTG